MQFILIQIFGYDLTAIELTVGAAGLLYGIAKVFQAVKDIRTLGWQPFKEHWIAPRQARTKKLDKLIGTVDDLVGKVDGVEQKVDRIDCELKTNGGSTLKDVVNSTADTVQKIQARIDNKDEYDPQPIFHLEANGEMCLANLAFRQLLDAEEQDLFRSNYLSRVASLAERQTLEDEIAKAIAKRIPFDVTVTFRLSAGRSTTVRLLASPNVLSGKELRGFIGTAKEVQS